MPNKQTTSLEERFDKFLMEFCPEYKIWWCDDDNTRWNILNNGDATEALLSFLHQELQAERQEIKRLIEGEKRVEREHHFLDYNHNFNKGLDKAIALIQGREGDGV